MKRIAVITPFILALTLDASAGTKLITTPEPHWYVAAHRGELYGPFRKESTAINFCMAQRTADCKVLPLVSPRTAGGSK